MAHPEAVVDLNAYANPRDTEQAQKRASNMKVFNKETIIKPPETILSHKGKNENVLPIDVPPQKITNLTSNKIKKGGKRKSRRSHKKSKKFNKSKKSVRKH
jgi:hypothetical protein